MTLASHNMAHSEVVPHSVGGGFIMREPFSHLIYSILSCRLETFAMPRGRLKLELERPKLEAGSFLLLRRFSSAAALL